MEIVKDKKIVQAWRGDDWEQSYYSKVEFRFEKKGKGCMLTFIHTGVPDKHYSGIKQGWKDHYWEKMKDYLKNKF